MRALAAALVLVAGAAGAGCDGGDEAESPKPVSGPAKQVAEVIARLESATARRDYREICEELFSAEVRRRAGGEDCPDLLRRTGGSVRKPEIEVESIRISGRTATARVRTRAEGQDEARDTVELVREAGSYRISSLNP